MYVWKENIFMAHVSLAPASTPVDRHPLLFWATVALAISALVHWRPLLLTGARRSASHRRPAPIILLHIGNRQSAGNWRSTSFLSLVNFCMVFATAFPLHLHTLYVFKECLPATSVQACPPSAISDNIFLSLIFFINVIPLQLQMIPLIKGKLSGKRQERSTQAC